MRRITFTGPINAFTGYGMHSLEIIRGMQARGYYVAVRPTAVDESQSPIPTDIKRLFVSGPQPEPWEILLHPPDQLPTPGKQTLFFTMWESTKMRAGGVQKVNKASVVVVPCNWNASCFSAEGVRVPIRIVPLGINTSVFSLRPPVRVPSENEPHVVFGSAARARHGGVRKGLQDVVNAFQCAFPSQDNVRLKIKCFSDDPDVQVDDARIELVRRFMPESELADWFASLDCFVSFSRGEGWGLMQHQSMCVGRPVIAARVGGLAEFMTPDNAYCVSYKMKPAVGGYAGMGLWAEPDFDDVVSAMRYVYHNRSEAESRGARAHESVAHLNWDNSVDKLCTVMREFEMI